jgi:hypothetical protein
MKGRWCALKQCLRAIMKRKRVYMSIWRMFIRRHHETKDNIWGWHVSRVVLVCIALSCVCFWAVSQPCRSIVLCCRVLSSHVLYCHTCCLIVCCHVLCHRVWCWLVRPWLVLQCHALCCVVLCMLFFSRLLVLDGCLVFICVAMIWFFVLCRRNCCLVFCYLVWYWLRLSDPGLSCSAMPCAL